LKAGVGVTSAKIASPLPLLSHRVPPLVVAAAAEVPDLAPLLPLVELEEGLDAEEELEVVLAAGRAAAPAAGFEAGLVALAEVVPAEVACGDAAAGVLDVVVIPDWVVADCVPPDWLELDWLDVPFGALAADEALVDPDALPAALVPAVALAGFGAGAAAAVPTAPPRTAVRAVAKAPADATDRLAIRLPANRRTSGSVAPLTPRPARMTMRTR
jgi:hypothetical protein